MLRPLKDLCVGSLVIGSLILATTGQAQNGQGNKSNQPGNLDSARPHHKKSTSFFVTYDVGAGRFLMSRTEFGEKHRTPARVVLAPNDDVEFRAVNFNPSTTDVEITVQAFPPSKTPTPFLLANVLSKVSSDASEEGKAGSTAETPASPPGGENEESIEQISTSNRLLDLLASALRSYKPSSDPAQVTQAIQDVKRKASEFLKSYIQTDPTALRAVSDDMRPRTLDLDSATRPENGVHTILVIAAARAKIARESAPGEYSRRRAEVVYKRYERAANTWRQIDGGTFFDVHVPDAIADDSVGYIVWTVKVKPAGSTTESNNPPKFTAIKQDKRNLEFAVSANIVASLLQDDSFFEGPKPSSGNGPITLQSKDDINFTTGAFLHVILGSGQTTVRPALSLGLTPDSDPKYMLGGSLIAGHDQRIVFTAGVITGKVKRLGNGLKLGDPVPADGNIPTQSVTRSDVFFSLGFKF